MKRSIPLIEAPYLVLEAYGISGKPDIPTPNLKFSECPVPPEFIKMQLLGLILISMLYNNSISIVGFTVQGSNL